MNINRGNNRKEKQMNAIIRTTSVAMLIALGLTPAARAAELPNPGTTADPVASGTYKSSMRRRSRDPFAFQ